MIHKTLSSAIHTFRGSRLPLITKKMRHLAKMGREIGKFLFLACQKLRDKERDFEDEGFLDKILVSILTLVNYKFRPFHFEIEEKMVLVSVEKRTHLYSEASLCL